MALSQKHPNKYVVPYYNSEEWRTVYNLIYSSNVEFQKKALNKLRVWKIRMPLLSSGIEATLNVLEALLQDDTHISEYPLRLMYSGALVRFLNLCAANSKKQGTFYETAKRNNIPDWMIDLRHNCSHGHTLPNKSMLKLSLEFALNWLEKEYWSVQNDKLSDLIVENKIVEETGRINALFSAFCEVSKKMHKKQKVDLNNHFNDMLWPGFSEVSTKLKAKQILPKILQSIKENYNQIDKMVFVNVFINKGDVLNLEILQDNSEEKRLPKDLIQTWEGVLDFFAEMNILIPLLKSLYNILNDLNENDSKKTLAVLWIVEILNSLLNNKNNISEEITETNQMFDTNLNIKNISHDMLDQLIAFKQYILDEPNKDTLQFLKPLLILCNCKADYINDTENLVKLYTIPENSKQLPNISSDTIQIAECKELLNSFNEDSEMVDLETATQDAKSNHDASPPKKRFRRVTDSRKYSGPIGRIARQTNSQV